MNAISDGGSGAPGRPEVGRQRSVEEERLVRAAYYANMAANLIERLDADSAGARDLLVENGYDIVGELRYIVAWAKEERDHRFPYPSPAASPREGA